MGACRRVQDSPSLLTPVDKNPWSTIGTTGEVEMIGQRKRPSDINARAASIVKDATGPQEAKSPAVVTGRIGGLKGGPARAAKLPPERRSEIARIARVARTRKGT